MFMLVLSVLSPFTKLIQALNILWGTLTKGSL
jgi:hypothetical protein